MPTLNKREGVPSILYGNLGVHILCSGPDPNGPIPGERIRVVIYDEEDIIVRRLEQIEGCYIDDGYVDFFNTVNCRPSIHEFHFVDIDHNGKQTILSSHTIPSDAQTWLKQNISNWARKHGISK